MNNIKIDLPREHEKIELHVCSDWHIGDKFCDYNVINKRLKQIRNTPNAYCILNGDLLNNATKTSVSDSYAEELAPMEQINKAIELFEPIKDKIIAITTGNHERRSYNKEGIDIMEIVAAQLQLKKRYASAGALLFIRVGAVSNGKKETNGSGNVRQICYTLYCCHGSGGGRKEGAKAIRLADMASIVDADIYVHSHTHLPMIQKQDYFRTDTANSKAQQVTRLFVNTASTLNYGGYGQIYEFKPSSKDNPVIFLNGKYKEAVAML